MKTYAEYKNSGIPWIGEIPKGWEVAQLRRYLSEKMKYGANESAESDNKDWPRYIRITDIDSDGNLREDSFKSLSPSKAKDYLLKKGDVLFARSGATVGKTYLHKGNETACFAGYLIRARCGNKLLPEYLYRYTQSGIYENWKNGIFIQATIQNIGADKYSMLLIPIPSPAEQRAIVAFLEKKTKQINDCIALRERELQTLNELKQAQIAQVVTKGLNHSAPMKDSGIPWIGEIPEHWEVNKINRLFKLIGSGTTPKGENCYTTENDGIPWINSGDLNYSILYKSKYYLTKETVANNTTLKIFPKGTLMIAMYGASIGKYAISQIDACTNQACCNLYGLQSNMNINYVSFLMNPCKTKWIEDSIGGTQPNISAEKIKQTWIPVPPLSEQTAIVQYLDNCTQTINSYISHLEKEIEHLKEYKQRLISDVVTGKIDVRDEA